MFNVPIKPERALNPSQLSKWTILLRDRLVGQDPRRSRTVKGVTVLTRKSVSLFLLNNTAPRTSQISWTLIDSSMAGKVVRQSSTLTANCALTTLDTHRLTLWGSPLTYETRRGALDRSGLRGV